MATAARMSSALDPTPKTGVWDQVLSFGQYQHVTLDGSPVVTEFDASKCKSMLDCFAAQSNDIFLDAQHEIIDDLGEQSFDPDAAAQYGRGESGHYGVEPGDGRARAWYPAMAMVVAGQVVRHEMHPAALLDESALAGLTGKDDGVYVYRAEVTPLGMDPKDGIPAYRYTSPFYTQERDGWRLINLTATNDPRMDGVGLAMSRRRRAAAMTNPPPAGGQTPTEKTRMDPQMMAAAGCAESDTPEQKLEKMAAYARKMSDDLEKAKQANSQAHPDEQQDRQLIDQALKEKTAALESTVKEQAASMEAMSRELKEIRDAKKAEKAEEFAHSALAMGRFNAKHKGDADKTRSFLAAQYKLNAAAAEELLSPDNTYPVDPGVGTSAAAGLMTRITVGGTPPGDPNGARRAGAGKHPFEEQVDKQLAEMKKTDPKATWAQAMQRVSRMAEGKKNAAAYIGRGREG